MALSTTKPKVRAQKILRNDVPDTGGLYNLVNTSTLPALWYNSINCTK